VSYTIEILWVAGSLFQAFTKDLLTDPIIRGVYDVQHTVVAAASSSSLSRAQEFLKEMRAPPFAKAYGSYAELVKDPNVDIIYVATPHSHHFQNAMLALKAGKHVLCEKAFTVNAAQAKKLVETAKEKNLFLMEAVWTRYFPISFKIREMVTTGVIGRVHRVIADLSVADAKDDGTLTFADDNRMVNRNLAGGALLDLGIYSLTWVFQILYHCQPLPRETPQIMAAINKYNRTGVDEMTSMILQFPKQKSMGIALTALRVATDPARQASIPSVRIQGTKGEIQVMGPAYRPTSYKLIMAEGNSMVEEVEFPIPTDPNRDGDGWGMYWEADEAARSVRDGKLESITLTWDESVLIMEAMDEVRRQGGLKYPELIETSSYDEKSPLNVGNQP
jgi:predicted dehydrogenase